MIKVWFSVTAKNQLVSACSRLHGRDYFEALMQFNCQTFDIAQWCRDQFRTRLPVYRLDSTGILERRLVDLNSKSFLSRDIRNTSGLTSDGG